MLPRKPPHDNNGLDIEGVDTREDVKEARVKNYIWIVARLLDVDMETVSSWTGFNILVRDNIEVIQDMIGYLTTINAPATEMSTIYEILNQSLLYKRALALENVIFI